MSKFVLDTNLYIAANHDPSAAEDLVGFYSAHLHFIYLHATVALELMLGALDAPRCRHVAEACLRPFESRG